MTITGPDVFSIRRALKACNANIKKEDGLTDTFYSITMDNGADAQKLITLLENVFVEKDKEIEAGPERTTIKISGGRLYSAAAWAGTKADAAVLRGLSQEIKDITSGRSAN